MRFLLLLTLLASLLFGEKVALVIGNSHYQYNPLSNPKNDSSDIAKVLRKKGFKVKLYQDLKKDKFENVVLTFWNRHRDSDLALFYFAGHGVSYLGDSYLLPTDNLFFHQLNRSDEVLVPKKSINLREIQTAMDRAKNGFNLLIVDACRNRAVDKRFRAVFSSC